MQARKKLGKPIIYRYEPGVSKPPGNFVFLNSSGNVIKNEINFKLTESNLNKKLEEELEEELEVELENDKESEKYDKESEIEKESEK